MHKLFPSLVITSQRVAQELGTQSSKMHLVRPVSSQKPKKPELVRMHSNDRSSLNESRKKNFGLSLGQSQTSYQFFFPFCRKFLRFIFILGQFTSTTNNGSQAASSVNDSSGIKVVSGNCSGAWALEGYRKNIF